MIITAKFASVCPCCSSRIEVGSKVEWSRGAKAVHVACAGSAPVARVAAATPTARRPYSSSRRSTGRWTGCSCGSREDDPRDSDCRQCRYDSM